MRLQNQLVLDPSLDDQNFCYPSSQKLSKSSRMNFQSISTIAAVRHMLPPVVAFNGQLVVAHHLRTSWLVQMPVTASCWSLHACPRATNGRLFSANNNL